MLVFFLIYRFALITSYIHASPPLTTYGIKQYIKSVITDVYCISYIDFEQNTFFICGSQPSIGEFVISSQYSDLRLSWNPFVPSVLEPHAYSPLRETRHLSQLLIDAGIGSRICRIASLQQVQLLFGEYSSDSRRFMSVRASVRRLQTLTYVHRARHL